MNSQRATLWVASAGLDICCLYAWAAFMLTLIHDRPYNSLQGATMFGCASLVARWLGKGQTSKLAHVFMLLLVTVASVDLSALSRSHEPQPWLTASASLGWSYTFWYAGARHGYEPPTYERVCSHFDRAIGWLAALFLFKLLLRGQASVNLQDGVSGTLIAAFFLFCALALALARDHGSAQKRFLSRYQAVSTLLGVGSGVVLCLLALSLLFLPQLQAAAQLGYDRIVQAGGPLGTALAHLMLGVLYLWMLIRGTGQAAPALKQQHTRVDPRPQHHEEAIIKLVQDETWLPWAACILVAAAVLGFILWVVTRLSKRTPAGSLPWLSTLRRLWLQLTQLRRQRRIEPEPMRLYLALTRWGRRSGVAACSCETPLEYGLRLQTQLPEGSAEIEQIVAAMNAHLYAPRTQPQSGHEPEQAALRRLHNPRLWPKRLKLWLAAAKDVEPEPRVLGEYVISEPGRL